MSILESAVTEPGSNPAAAPSVLASVLVIDDEEIVCSILSALLKAEGFDAVTARSGKEGVELLRARPFEAAIADLVMPGMDGIQTISALKEVDPDVEVIILTGHVTMDSTIAALRRGACDFLQKPTGLAQLRPALMRALEKRRGKLTRMAARVRAVIETAREAIILFDREGVVRDFNPMAEQIFGWSRQQAVGRNLADFAIPPRRLDGFRKHLETAYREGKHPLHGCIEVLALRENGEEFSIEISTAVIETPQGKLLSTFGRDITERKRAEADLVKYAEDLEVAKAAQEENGQELARLVEEFARERDLLCTLMDNLPDYIYYKDCQSRFVRTNPAHAKALGLSDPREAVGKTDYDFFPEEDAQGYFRDEQQVIETGQPLNGRMERARLSDGQYRWYLASKVPIRDTQGRVTGLVGISRDMTEIKQAEEKLRASEERYRELFENASDLVYTMDLEGRLTSLNRVAEQTIGYTQEEATQMNIRQLVDPKYWEQMDRAFERALAGDTHLKLELEVTAKDGRRVMLEVNPRLIYKDGKPVGAQAIARDITGRDAAELELRHAQKLESVGRLAAGIAHEINTPIQFVGDNTRFLQDSFAGLQALLGKYQELRNAADAGGVSPELLADVRHVEETSDCSYLMEEIPRALTQTLEGVDRVATIVRAMKEFAHPEGHEKAAADLNRALLSTLTVARNELKYVADVETEFGDLPLVVCNIGDLNQVFLNILVNAAHAIGESVQGTGRKGKIRVRTAPENGTVLVSITDTGGGIPEANRGKIFDPFFTTKEVGRGTGQGLAIARSVVVEKHRGALSFESEVGKGTTFYIRLPVDPGQCPKEAKAP